MTLRSLIIVFAVAFAAFLVAKAPLGLALSLMGPAARDLAYSHAEGTVWEGKLTRVSMKGVDLGTAELSLSPVSLFSLSPKLDWRLAGGAVTGKGRLTQSLMSGALTLEDASLAADLARLPTMVPLGGVLAVSLSRLEWRDNQCVAGDILLRSNVLSQRPMGLDWQGPVLDGDAGCADGVLDLHMAGQDAQTILTIEAAVTPDFAYSLSVATKSQDTGLNQALMALGFSTAGDGLERTFQGRIGLMPQEL